MENSSATANDKRNLVTRPRWSHWEKMPGWTLSEGVALSLNISPTSVPKLSEKNPRKLKTFNARLKVANRQLIGCFEDVEVYGGNDMPEKPRMVSPKSFVSFAMNYEGWRKTIPQAFIDIGKANGTNVSKADNDEKVQESKPTSSKTPVKFIAALIRLLVEIAYRDAIKGNKFDVDNMLGIRADFQRLAGRFDKINLNNKEVSTFNTYIKGLCKFNSGSDSSTYYSELFPELTSSLGQYGEKNTVVSSG